MRTTLPRVTVRRLAQGLVGQARAFARSRSGVGAVEFAIIGPVMVTMLLAMTEVTSFSNTNRKMKLVARTLADLTGRFTTMTAGDMNNVFAAAGIVMQPYAISTTKLVVSSVTVTTSGSTTTGTIAWSCAQGTGASARTVNSKYTVPANFTSATSFVLVETSMTYAPLLGGQFLAKSWLLGETLPWPVRNGAQVAWSGTAC